MEVIAVGDGAVPQDRHDLRPAQSADGVQHERRAAGVPAPCVRPGAQQPPVDLHVDVVRPPAPSQDRWTRFSAVRATCSARSGGQPRSTSVRTRGCQRRPTYAAKSSSLERSTRSPDHSMPIASTGPRCRPLVHSGRSFRRAPAAAAWCGMTRLAAATLVTGDGPLLDDLLRLSAAVGVVLTRAGSRRHQAAGPALVSRDRGSGRRRTRTASPSASTLTTLNQAVDPARRADMAPAPIGIGRRV